MTAPAGVCQTCEGWGRLVRPLGEPAKPGNYNAAYLYDCPACKGSANKGWTLDDLGDLPNDLEKDEGDGGLGKASPSRGHWWEEAMWG